MPIRLERGRPMLNRFKEVLFKTTGETNTVYVLREDGRWHCKAFPASMTIQHITARIDVGADDPVLWPTVNLPPPTSMAGCGASATSG